MSYLMNLTRAKSPKAQSTNSFQTQDLLGEFSNFRSEIRRKLDVAGTNPSQPQQEVQRQTSPQRRKPIFEQVSLSNSPQTLRNTKKQINQPNQSKICPNIEFLQKEIKEFSISSLKKNELITGSLLMCPERYSQQQSSNPQKEKGGLQKNSRLVAENYTRYRLSPQRQTKTSKENNENGNFVSESFNSLDHLIEKQRRRLNEKNGSPLNRSLDKERFYNLKKGRRLDQVIPIDKLTEFSEILANIGSSELSQLPKCYCEQVQKVFQLCSQKLRPQDAFLKKK